MQDTPKIRVADAEDVEALSALAQETYADAFGATMNAADLGAHLAKNLSPVKIAGMLEADTFLVAETDGRMVGYVQFGVCDFEGADPAVDVELRRLYVLAEIQNKGIGSQLLTVALEQSRMKNAPRIFLDVWEHNHGARRLYERYGFQVVGSKSFDVESGSETSMDLVMVRKK